MNRNDLQDIVINALKYLKGSASIVEVAKYIWENHKSDLESSGDLLYTWQYDMRWAATKLRNDGVILPADVSPRGVWRLNIR